MWRGRQSSGHFDILIVSGPTYKFALTPVHIFPGVHKTVIMHESFTECIFKICTWIQRLFPPSHSTPHVLHPAQTVWQVSQSPTCRMPQVHNRKRDSNFWEVYLALFFWINLLNVFANIPNEGSFKCFTKQFLKLVSLQWKNKGNTDGRMGIMSVNGEDHQLSKITQGHTLVPLSNIQNLSCWGLFFREFFHILMLYEIAIPLLWQVGLSIFFNALK